MIPTISQPGSKLGKLYKEVSAVYNTGTFDDFQASLSSPEKMMKAYAFVSERYNAGTYDDFVRSLDELMQTAKQRIFLPSDREITTTGYRMPATPESEALRRSAQQKSMWDQIAEQPPSIRQGDPDLATRAEGLRNFADFMLETVGGVTAPGRNILQGGQRIVDALSRIPTGRGMAPKPKADVGRAVADLLLGTASTAISALPPVAFSTMAAETPMPTARIVGRRMGGDRGEKIAETAVHYISAIPFGAKVMLAMAASEAGPVGTQKLLDNTDWGKQIPEEDRARIAEAAGHVNFFGALGISNAAMRRYERTRSGAEARKVVRETLRQEEPQQTGAEDLPQIILRQPGENGPKEFPQRDEVIHGLDIRIENPAGSTRKGTSSTGENWSREMSADYGFIKGVKGKDKEQIDVFVGPDPESQHVFVVNQKKRGGKEFDEHKVIVGTENEAEAKQLYREQYPTDWEQQQGGITGQAMDIPQFHHWLKTGDKNKPAHIAPANRTIMVVDAAIIEDLRARNLGNIADKIEAGKELNVGERNIVSQTQQGLKKEPTERTPTLTNQAPATVTGPDFSKASDSPKEPLFTSTGDPTLTPERRERIKQNLIGAMDHINDSGGRWSGRTQYVRRNQMLASRAGFDLKVPKTGKAELWDLGMEGQPKQIKRDVVRVTGKAEDAVRLEDMNADQRAKVEAAAEVLRAQEFIAEVRRADRGDGYVGIRMGMKDGNYITEGATLHELLADREQLRAWDTENSTRQTRNALRKVDAAVEATKPPAKQIPSSYRSAVQEMRKRIAESGVKSDELRGTLRSQLVPDIDPKKVLHILEPVILKVKADAEALVKTGQLKLEEMAEWVARHVREILAEDTDGAAFDKHVDSAVRLRVGQGDGDFGPIFPQFKGKTQEAVEHLRKAETGDAIGALNHPEIGAIDLVWGQPGTGKSTGYGLSKIAARHPEVLNDLQAVVTSMSVKERTSDRIQLESATHKGAVALTYFGKEKRWLLTAYEKKQKTETPSAPGKTIDVPGSFAQGKGGRTAPLPTDRAAENVQREAGNVKGGWTPDPTKDAALAQAAADFMNYKDKHHPEGFSVNDVPPDIRPVLEKWRKEYRRVTGKRSPVAGAGASILARQFVLDGAERLKSEPAQEVDVETSPWFKRTFPTLAAVGNDIKQVTQLLRHGKFGDAGKAVALYVKPRREQMGHDAFELDLKMQRELGRSEAKIDEEITRQFLHGENLQRLERIFGTRNAMNVMKKLRELPYFGDLFGVKRNRRELLSLVAESIKGKGADGKLEFGAQERLSDPAMADVTEQMRKTMEERNKAEARLINETGARTKRAIRTQIAELSARIEDLKEEAGKLQQNTQMTDRIIDGVNLTQEGQPLYDQLTPSEKGIIDWYTDWREEMKDRYEIGGEVEGYVRRFMLDPRHPFAPMMMKFRNNKFFNKMAKSRFFRVGGAYDYIRDLEAVPILYKGELEQQRIHNTYIPLILQSMVEPTVEGPIGAALRKLRDAGAGDEALKVKKQQLQADPEMAAQDQAWRDEGAGVKTGYSRIDKSFVFEGSLVRISGQMNSLIYDEYMRLVEEMQSKKLEKAEVVKAVHKLAKNGSDFWTANQLIAMQSVANQAVSDAVYYGSRMAKSLATDAANLGASAVGKTKFQPVRFWYDVRALADALRPSMLKSLTPEEFGGRSTFMSQFTIRERYNNPWTVTNTPLKLWKAGTGAYFKLFNWFDLYAKRSLFISEGKFFAHRKMAEMVARGVSKEEMKKEVLTWFEDPETLRERYASDVVEKFSLHGEVPRTIDEVLDMYMPNYANVPIHLEKFADNFLGKLVIPFVRYRYEDTRIMGALLRKAYQAAFSPGKMPADERIGYIIAASAIFGGMTALQSRYDNDKLMATDEDRAKSIAAGRFALKPGSAEDKAAREALDAIGIELEEGNTLMLRASKYPFVKIALMFRSVPDFEKVVQSEFVSEGIALRLAASAAGWSDEFNQHMSWDAKMGNELRSLIPFHRVMEDINRINDPRMLTTETWQDAIKKAIPWVEQTGKQAVSKETGQPMEINPGLAALLASTGINIADIPAEDMVIAAEGRKAKRQKSNERDEIVRQLADPNSTVDPEELFERGYELGYSMKELLNASRALEAEQEVGKNEAAVIRQFVRARRDGTKARQRGDKQALKRAQTMWDEAEQAAEVLEIYDDEIQRQFEDIYGEEFERPE